MKKRAAKARRAAKPSAAKGKKKAAGAGARKSAAKAATRTARAGATAATPKAPPYTPAPLKGDGWPPFRYPLQ